MKCNNVSKVVGMAVMMSLILEIGMSAQGASAVIAYTLTVNSVNQDGATITGYNIAVYSSSGSGLKSGFTPTSFALNGGQYYSVQADSFGACKFNHWTQTSTTTNLKTISMTGNTQLTAVYDCAAVASTMTVKSVNQNGIPITGYYTALYNSAGGMAASGFTPKTFSTTVGQVYSVVAHNYGGCTFGHWSESNPESLTAAYNCTGVIIPLYASPSSPAWAAIAKAKIAYPAIPFVVVINPNSGPGKAEQASYASGIAMLQKAGVVVLGYVCTKFGAEPISSVEANMSRYASWYHVNGIWFDNMASHIGHEDYYASLTSYAVSLGMSMTVGNAGVAVAPTYIGTVSFINNYENPSLPTSAYLDSLGSSKTDFTMLAYDIPTLNSTFVAEAAKHVSYLYITNLPGPNPWTGLPTYFDALLSDLS